MRGKKPDFIYKKLKEFGFHATIPEIQSIYMDVKSSAPPSIVTILEAYEPIDISKKNNKEFCKHLGILEYIDYIQDRQKNTNNKKGSRRKEYYKWFDDVQWIIKYPDIMSLVAIFMFNNESLDEISTIINFKYRKKISLEALQRFSNIFWDTKYCTAKDAIVRCLHFKDNSLIVKTLATGEQNLTLLKNVHEDNGCDTNVIFHPIEYIKWKIGYRKITPPKPQDFIEKVQSDSYYKYYETMNMNSFRESVFEESLGGEFGDINTTKINYKNTEEQKAKLAKHWFDMYVKAYNALPDEGESDKEFFDKLDQYSLEFEEEKIVKADEVEGLMDDIREDLQ